MMPLPKLPHCGTGTPPEWEGVGLSHKWRRLKKFCLAYDAPPQAPALRDRHSPGRLNFCGIEDSALHLPSHDRLDFRGIEDSAPPRTPALRDRLSPGVGGSGLSHKWRKLKKLCLAYDAPPQAPALRDRLSPGVGGSWTIARLWIIKIHITV